MADKSILNDCKNLWGRLEGDSLKRLRDVLANPTQETWEEAFTLIISINDGWVTLWQAVLAVDPTFPQGKGPDGLWPRVPDSLTIARAIRESAGKVAEQEANVPFQRVVQNLAVMVETALTTQGEFTILWREESAKAELFHEGSSVGKNLSMPEAREAAGELFKKLQTIAEEEAEYTPGPR